ncbi:MAG: leucine-rich repeat domain-containing protein, partial [Clostridia bacterium]|nr:leucine-rich repeat domain-containing protein [Clostridia bacterium]
MKKKILLLVSLFALLACIFAVVVGAAGVATDEFGVAETLENIPVDLTDTTSRVVLKGADGLYRTFPSSYIYFKTGSGNWGWRGEAKCNFEYLNSALGLTEGNAYTIDSVVRIEVPDDLKYLEGYNGKTNLKEMYFSKTSEMTNLRPMGSSGLEKITMPPKQNSFADYMFHTCSNLTTVIFYENENLVSLPLEMFKACTALKEFTVPSSVTTIGNSAFISCSALESIDLGNVTKIGDNAFSSCTSLTNIDIPNTVQSIGQNAFRSSGLTSIIIPSSVTSIGNYAFHSSKVTSVEFKSRTTELSLGNVGVFQSCSSLTSITLTEGITAIGQDCFSGNKAEEIIVPDSVKTIGSGAFNSTVTKRIIISENSQLETMYAFSQAKAVESLYLPTGVKIIGSGFHYCYKLQRIDNFENVIMEIGSNKENTIPTNFFQECPLVEIKLPKTLGTISSGAFNGCKALQKIYIPSTVTSIDQSLFNGNLNNTVIFYCGTAEELLSITTDGNGATFIQNRIDAGSVVEYTTMAATYANGVIVENVNACDAFYAGIHEENDKIALVWLDKDGNAGEAFLSYLKVACPCGRECGKETVIDTLAPLFIDRGFAYGPNSMLQGVAVDRELLDEYGKYFTGIKYGLVAAAKSAQAS